MRAVAILWAIAACSAKGNLTGSTSTSGKIAVTSAPACRDAYAEYETRWRVARTEEVAEIVAGDADVLEEILYYELATLPSRDEVEKLRVIYAVVEALLWTAPWPQALAATEMAIQRCGEKTARPPT